jgi:hypothetical protein
MAINEFRRNTKSDSKRAGGGKGFGNWRERWRLPQSQSAPFVLIEGDYPDPHPDPEQVEVGPGGQPNPVLLPYYKFRQHKRKIPNRAYPLSGSCSKGWDDYNPQPCVGCAYMDSGDKAFSLSDQVAIGVIHLGLYHRHSVWDEKTNDWMKSKKEGANLVYNETEHTDPKTCNFCKYMAGQQVVLKQGETFPAYQPQHLSWVFGSRRYLEIGKGHLGDLSEWDKQIGMHCGGTKWAKDSTGNYLKDPSTGQYVPIGSCNNQLNVDGYICPTCNTMLINAETDSRDLKTLEELAFKKYPCHVCQKQVFLKEVNSCDICGPTNTNGGQAVVRGIFDGVLHGMRQGEGTQSHLVLTQFTSIQEFEASLSPEIKALIGKPLTERIDELSKPYDFAELFKAQPLAKQAERLQVQVPAQYAQYVQAQGPQQAMPPSYGQSYVPQPGGFAPPTAPPAQQQFIPYASTPGGPGPAPFVAPPKPNFGK